MSIELNMKKSILVVVLFSIFIFVACNHENQKENNKNTSPMSEKEIPKKLLRHVVLFNFNETATEETIKSIEKAFAALPKQISEIHAFEWGINNSEEKLDKGLTHCFLVTFLTKEDRDAYLPHPAHQAFVKLLDGYIEDVTVVDYWTK